jgi:hypothetical protein
MTVDTKEVIEKMSQAVFDGDEATITSLATPDCMVVGPDGKSVPFVEYWVRDILRLVFLSTCIAF